MTLIHIARGDMMSITYDKIRAEIKGISQEIANSKEMVPSPLDNIRSGLLPTAIYFSFFIACAFTDAYIKNVWQAVGLVSLFFWVFIIVFISGYAQMFSLLPKDAPNRYEIVRVYRKNVKIYYSIWVSAVVLGGLISLLSLFNILALAAITLLSTVFLALFFYLYLSRYQLSGLIGSLSAPQASINS
mgnify:CR=1 FL=1